MDFEGLALPELIILVAIFIVYFMPWCIAMLREHDRRFMIGLLNLLLGWTLIGWLIAFLWAAAGKTKTGHEQEETEQAHAIERHVPVGSAAGRKYSQAS